MGLDINIEINLEISRAVETIKKNNYKKVCIQLPDGLKPRAKEICDKIKAETGAETLIWAGSCFGACDIPHALDKLGVELLIQWGHSEFKQD